MRMSLYCACLKGARLIGSPYKFHKKRIPTVSLTSAFHISAKNMTKARKFVLAKRFVGEPKESDLKLVEEELPPLRDKEILVEAEWLSVDPYMKPYSAWLPVGTTMLGGQVARVIESCNPDIKVGDRLMGYFGWRDKTVVDMRQSNNLPMPEKPYVLPDFEGLPASLGVGVLGMPGNTAYFGFLEICRPQPGEVVVVSGAAGAVGSLVGQIAKLKGCKVIGFAGTDDKVRWLKEELNFDEAFNYKTENPTLVLKQAAPEGVDCYFDNAGGELSSAILNRMNQGGRIAVCGSTSSYNAVNKLPAGGPASIDLQGVEDGRFHRKAMERSLAGRDQTKHKGKLKYRETVTEGFENMPKAFIGMLRGENTGKAVPSMADDAAVCRNTEPDCAADLKRSFECPICLVFMNAHIYQCRNGHSLCGPCRDKVADCPTCQEKYINVLK
uniref:Prostaglandin reductase 1 n=1 Tax=Timema monikensis TaxID=170555 RepID=A0A7R9DYV0_9NEOP|nr:unnamed protein product [Timema monikensis]